MADPGARERGSKSERCRKCGYTRRHHCDLDEPGLDHAAGCPKQHHEFVAELASPGPSASPDQEQEHYECESCGRIAYNQEKDVWLV